MKIKNILIALICITFLTSCSKSNSNDDNEPTLSSENKILSFDITVNGETFNGNINHNSKTINLVTIGLEQVPFVTPNIEISENATIVPSENVQQDLSNNVQYVVTAENGDIAIYTVTTQNTPFSTENDILSFNFTIDDEQIIGLIDNTALKITLETYKEVTNILPEIVISDLATVSPSATSYQDFTNPIEYTVTAQDGSSKIYTVTVYKPEINSTLVSCYIRANSNGNVSSLDITNINYELYLENDINSYPISYSIMGDWYQNEVLITNFNFDFPENIATANDYKLRFKLEGETKAETSYFIDVLADNAPEIISSNQDGYYFNDTLILYGTNLLPGLRIPANGSIYQYNENYLTVNNEGTELTFVLDVNHVMFPSWVGQTSPRPTTVSIYYNGRYGDSIIVDFY